ncbi:MAG: TonB-dependent receptor [Bacteroides sp.]|nr:TonB-dependent receptor [Bacteroides sp.]MCM1085936.1 TonB-dependent receptor [Bacteroides sp.]
MIIFLWGTACTAVLAQSGIYSGSVFEYGANTPLEFVNVMVFDTNGHKLAGGAVTDEKGAFNIARLPLNRPLQATFSAMGFGDLKGPVFRLSGNKPALNAGSVYMKTAAQMLEAVTITGQKRTIEYSLDRKVVNVEQSLVSDGGSAVDVLQNVPSISVDEEGNVSMKGSESVTILIDGRPATLSGLGLEQISANNIANIEIISNPSAKYNPEGTSGIINIITKERKSTGVNGSVYASASTANRYGLGTNLSFGFKKVTLFTNLDVNYRNRGSSGSSTRTSFRGDNPLYPLDNTQIETGKSDNRRGGYGGKFQLGADFRITPKDNFLISGTFETWEFERRSKNPATETFSRFDPKRSEDASGTAYPDSLLSPHWIRSLGTSSIDRSLMLNGQGAISYVHKFGKPQQELSLDATVNYHNSHGKATNNRSMLTLHDSSFTRQNTVNDRQGVNFDAQLNYLHPFNEKLSLEVGYQAKVQWQKTVSHYDTRLNEYQDTSMFFDYIEHNHGIYANLMGKFGKFTFQVGGRMEADLMTAKKKTETADTSFDYSHFRFYPAVHLSYKIGEKQELQLSYSRRVNRPRPHNLDPYVDYADYPSSISYGNPDLKPQDIHSIELNYSLFLKSSSFYVTVYYRYLKDLIRRYQFEAEYASTGEILLNRTFHNYAHGNTYGFDISYEQQLLKWWRMSLSGSLYQNTTSDKALDESSAAEGISYNLRFNTTMNLPLDFVVQLSCRYSGPSYWGQTKFDQSVSGELAVRKNFLKKKLNVGLRVSDLFHTQQWNRTVTGEGFVSYNKRRPKNSTALYVTLSYKINKGEDKQRRKRLNSNEDNGFGGGGMN